LLAAISNRSEAGGDDISGAAAGWVDPACRMPPGCWSAAARAPLSHGRPGLWPAAGDPVWSVFSLAGGQLHGQAARSQAKGHRCRCSQLGVVAGVTLNSDVDQPRTNKAEARTTLLRSNKASALISLSCWSPDPAIMHPRHLFAVTSDLMLGWLDIKAADPHLKH
jgi:hypothetical protein